jgi:cytochrome c553
MKTITIVLTVAAVIALAAPAFAAGDAVAGKQKAAPCVACHGNDSFGGIFYTLQLAGRNADKLTVKTNKYRSGKILHPLMNLATIPLNDKDIGDISAYYQSLGKPAVTSPFFQVKGDDDAPGIPPVTQAYITGK